MCQDSTCGENPNHIPAGVWGAIQLQPAKPLGVVVLSSDVVPSELNSPKLVVEVERELQVMLGLEAVRPGPPCTKKNNRNAGYVPRCSSRPREQKIHS